MGLVSASAADGKKGFDGRVFLSDGGGEGGDRVCVLGGNVDLVGGGIEIGECAEKMSEKGGVDARGRKSAVEKPVAAFHHSLDDGEVVLQHRKKGE